MMNMMPAGASTANVAEQSDGYIRIGDMAKQFGLTLRTLRFYEDKGLLNPKRDGNQRLYAQRDVSRLKLIMLGTKVGFSLREIKHIMDLYDPNGSNVKQLRTLVDKSERQIVKLEKQRAELDEAINELTGAVAKWRSALVERQAA